jgi:DNA-binding SARP family transcriptional activator/class 3 adenylate cyclase
MEVSVNKASKASYSDGEISVKHLMTKNFRITLLGQFQYAGADVHALPRKAVALLAYLAANQGRKVARDQLADLLWSAGEQEQSRHSLRQALTVVRRAVPGGSPIRAAIAHVVLDGEGVEVDVQAFTRLAQSTSLADLRAAAELYRGEFLSDLDIPSEPFAEWVEAERSRLGAIASVVLRRLALALHRAGDQEGAIANAQRLIARDQLNEEGHRLLMELYARAGRRGEALRQYAACVDQLKRELDVAPDETTVALAAAIRAGGSTFPEHESDEPVVAYTTNAPAIVNEPEVLESLGTQGEPAPLAGHNRQLTVLATELVGLVWLAGRPEPEDIAEATATCCRRCAQLIEGYGGYVARVASDGMLAYFGYPQAHELDPENAVRAALELKTLAASLSAELNVPLEPCIGIATGIVVVGNEARSALGEAITRSARLQAMADPGQILVAGCTRRLLGQLFEYRDVGTVAFKGLRAPVEVTEVLGANADENRFEAYHSTTLSPLVGRDEEINGLLRRWRQAKKAEGSVVLLVGEPGIGKSRTILALSERLGGETRALLRLFCSPHHQGSPLHPFINQLEREAGFRRSDSAEQRLSKLEAIATGTSQALPLLAQLLGIEPRDGPAMPPLTPQQRKEQTFKALLARIETLTASRPAILVIEDLHWADPTTLELTDLIVQRVPRQRLLVILTARPEFAPPWAGRLQTSVVTLGRLPSRQCAVIISSLCQGKRLPNAVVESILDRADGIPLFVEELTKTVVESGALADQGDGEAAGAAKLTANIPMTLYASLLARLDRLPAARDAVQLGAALGRNFSHQLITAAAAIPQRQLEEALQQLVQAELIWRRGSPPDADYTFKHALVQDAAYATLRRDGRRTLHARIAEVYESQFPEIGETQPELLAHHCTEAGLTEKAAYLWGRAGELSMARSALKEAAAQFTRALALVDVLAETPAVRREQIKLQIALANALMHTSGYASPETRTVLGRARSLVQRAEALGEPPEDPLLFLSVLHGFWVASHVGFDGNAVRELSTEFMALAKKQGTPFALVLANRVMGTSLLYLGDIVGARDHLDKALALYEPAKHRSLGARFGQEAGVAILSNRLLALWLLGYPEAALKDAENGLEHARTLGQTGSYIYALTRIAWVHLVIGNYAVAKAQVRELVTIAGEMDGSYWKAAATILQGCLFALTGKGAAAIDMITSGIAASRTSGANLLRMPWYLSCLARAQLAVGHLDEAQRCIGEAVTAMATSQESWQESELYRIQGDLARVTSNEEDAQACYERAIAVAREQHAKSWELRAALGLARLWRDQGKRQQALDLLAPIYRWFKDGFDTVDLKEASILLAELRSLEKSL